MHRFPAIDCHKKMKMPNKKLSLIIILFISVLNMGTDCHRTFVDIPFQYTFLIPVNISPLKKSYSVSDTIWLTTNLPGKYIFDTKSNQNVLVDTAQITFGANFFKFGDEYPYTGFCDVITLNGVNTNATGGSIENFGCGQSNYTCKIGFKLNKQGTYWLHLMGERPLANCSTKIIPYHASISYKYEAGDLNMDIFNSLSENDKGGKDGIKFYTGEINNRQLLVVKVE